MKLNNKIRYIVSLLFLSAAMASCEDLLNQEPPSYIIPEEYFRTEQQVQACANKYYTDVLPSHGGGDYGLYAGDNKTDNQAGKSADAKYADGQWKVGMDNDEWAWSNIRDINYQLNTILSNYQQGLISGTDKNIRQYIGELYFLRGYKYFSLLQKWGDLPILTTAMPDNEEMLVAANKRMPRNEVARFIINNLDTALTYMTPNFESRHTRISSDVATLVKSRVALFEASWLYYFKETPFVPNGEGWPGKEKDYNANYQYRGGSIDSEIEFFLKLAVENSETIAEAYKGKLTQNNNTGVIPQSPNDPENPYFSMFGTLDMSKNPEILLWREYSYGLGVRNNVEDGVQRGNRGVGVTRGLVESFLMADGKPIYASSYDYDDTSLNKVVEHRDPRLTVFLKVPGQKNAFKNMDDSHGDRMVETEPARPDITNGSDDWAYPTGYALRKGGTFDRSQCSNGNAANAACCFRATEALLNYMEAKYLLNKIGTSGDKSDAKIMEYWKLIRERAGFKGAAADPNTTIQATSMAKEVEGKTAGTAYDWGAFSKGDPLGQDDVTLYCIRRERRCEFIGENMRWMDLIRWRSLDQLKDHKYHIEGFRLWESQGAANLLYDYGFEEKDYDGSNSATVSSPSLSAYLRPYEKNMTGTNLFRDGYTWHKAHYLQPMPIREMQLTAPDRVTVSESSLYQNPYWPTITDMSAEE